jgi:hypothetical protein
MTIETGNQNPWDDGFGPNVQRFFTYQFRAILHLIISILLIFVLGAKWLQKLIKKS